MCPVAILPAMKPDDHSGTNNTLSGRRAPGDVLRVAPDRHRRDDPSIKVSS
jgi:hypothetical protein